MKEEDEKDEELVDDKPKSVEISLMVSVEWESGPLRERPGIIFSERVKSWGSPKEKNNRPEGILKQSQQKLLSSLSCCPFLNLARSADLHECDVFMALVIIGSDSSMTEQGSTLYGNRLKGGRDSVIKS